MQEVDKCNCKKILIQFIVNFLVSKKLLEYNTRVLCTLHLNLQTQTTIEAGFSFLCQLPLLIDPKHLSCIIRVKQITVLPWQRLLV